MFSKNKSKLEKTRQQSRTEECLVEERKRTEKDEKGKAKWSLVPVKAQRWPVPAPIVSGALLFSLASPRLEAPCWS
jgi:hypothetical protein